MDVAFSINLHDNEGDVFDECVLLHIGDVILRFGAPGDVRDFVANINRCLVEIDEHYADE